MSENFEHISSNRDIFEKCLEYNYKTKIVVRIFPYLSYCALDVKELKIIGVSGGNSLHMSFPWRAGIPGGAGCCVRERHLLFRGDPVQGMEMAGRVSHNYRVSTVTEPALCISIF